VEEEPRVVDAPYAIELTGMVKRFPTSDGGVYTAVSGIDLAVPAGRFVSVVGPTGCGKSTLLNAAAGLAPPSEGSVRIFGEPLEGLNKRASYMFQQDALLPWRTVLDNVTLGPRMKGVGRAEREQRGREWLERVGLGPFAGAYPHQLSGGMRRRVAVAQSWIVDPDFIFMDEPFSALDVQTRQLMEDQLLRLWTGSGKTVVFVTHDLDEAISLADEVVLLSAGPASRIVGTYPIDLPRPRDLMDIRTTPAFQDLYRAIWSDLRSEVMKSYERRALAVSNG
jgi:NitT/TauT family transport system ATP-binding protein